MSDTRFTIRQMTEDDLDEVERLEREIFADPWSRASFRQDLCRQQSLALVAVDNNLVAGYVVAWVEGELHVANIAVAPKYRRKGIGRAFISRVEDFGSRLGAGSVYLEVRQSNTGAQAFYRNLGFVRTHVRKGYYSNGEDAVVMEKDIAPLQE